MFGFLKKIFKCSSKSKTIQSSNGVKEESKPITETTSKKEVLDTFDLNKNIVPEWLEKGKPVPEELEEIHFLAVEAPKLSESVSEKVGKSLENRFKVSPSAINIISVLNDEKSTAAQISEAASKDINLVNRLLRTVNSAAFALSSEISSADHAIKLLGLNTLRSLAVSSMVKTEKGFSEKQKRMWVHAAMTSACAQGLSRHHSGINDGEAATAGLLANMGALLLEQEEIKKLSEASGLHPLLIESYGAASFAKIWELPQVIGKIISHTNIPFFYPMKSIPEEIRRITLLVAFSSFVVSWYGFAEDSENLIVPSETMLKRIGINVKGKQYWIPADIAFEMEKARISMESFIN